MPTFNSIGFTLLYFKMGVIPLVPETKMADVSIQISLGNLLARRTTWLVLKTTSATSIFCRVFGANSMTRIFYKYSNLPTLTLSFTISLGESTQLSCTFSLTESTHSFQCDFQREHAHSPFQLTESTHSSLFLTFDIQQSNAMKMYTLCNHSFPSYTFSARLFPASNTEISSSQSKKQIVEILSQHAQDTC